MTLSLMTGWPGAIGLSAGGAWEFSKSSGVEAIKKTNGQKGIGTQSRGETAE